MTKEELQQNFYRQLQTLCNDYIEKNKQFTEDQADAETTIISANLTIVGSILQELTAQEKMRKLELYYSHLKSISNVPSLFDMIPQGSA